MRLLTFTILLIICFSKNTLSQSIIYSYPEIELLRSLKESFKKDNWDLQRRPFNLSGITFHDSEIETINDNQIRYTYYIKSIDLDNPSHGRVSSGFIPENIDDLKRIENINFRNLSGNIPFGLTNIETAFLQSIKLSFIDFQGLIPDYIGQIEALQSLLIFRGEGSIPPSIGNLTNLELLWVSGDEITGIIPPSIGNLNKLKTLRLYGTFHGSIPSSIGNLTSLESLRIWGRDITGTLPSSIGNLRTLKNLDLQGSFTGSIPSSIENLKKLESLTLNGKSTKRPGLLTFKGKLTGSLNVIAKLPNIRFLDLSNNQITGEIPEILGELPNLYQVDLSYNQLSGKFPSTIGNIGKNSTSAYLYLEGNDLEGPLPESIKLLRDINVSGNNVNSSFEDVLEVISSDDGISFLADSAGIFGNIPEEIREYHFDAISFSHNDLTDTIPNNTFKNFEYGPGYINFSHNKLTGNIPYFKANGVYNIFNFNDNNFDGCIADSLFQDIEHETYIDLSNNPKLYGSLPKGIYSDGISNQRWSNVWGLRFHNTSICEPPDNQYKLFKEDISQSPMFQVYGNDPDYDTGISAFSGTGIECNNIKLVIIQQGQKIGKKIQLWNSSAGSEGNILEAEIVNDTAKFYFERDEEIGTIDQLFVLDAAGEPIGKIGFRYLEQEKNECACKESIITLHNDLIAYQDHPIEKNNKQWGYPNWYKYDLDDPGSAEDGTNVNGKMYQVTMLVPPVDSYGSYILDSIDQSNKPVLFVHGINGTDRYWGNKKEGGDYDSSSYTAQLGALQPETDIWEYYYPPDQSWNESSYLLGRDIKALHNLYNKKVSVVAHSMGGLVTRGYIEETNSSFLLGGSETTIDYGDEVDKVLFLGTPQHGSFGGNRNFFGVYNQGLELLESGTRSDVFAPAVRDLSLGNPLFGQLNDKSLNRFNSQVKNNDIEYMVFAGTTWERQVPSWGEILDRVDLSSITGKYNSIYSAYLLLKQSNACTPFIIESEDNDDGIVSTSSASLLNFGVDLGLLQGFSHKDLRTPEGISYGGILPSLISEYLVNDEVDKNKFIRYLTSTDIQVGEAIEDTNGQCPDIRLDIALPMVDIKGWNDYRWIDKGSGIRFGLDVAYNDTGAKASLSGKRFKSSTAAYEDSGMYLYFGGNNFTSPDYKNSIDKEGYLFYGFRNDGFIFPFSNPLSTTRASINGINAGWHLPEHNELSLPVEFGFNVVRSEVFFPNRRRSLKWSKFISISEPGSTLDLKVNATTYSSFDISGDRLNLLSADQYIDQTIISTFEGSNQELFNWVDPQTEMTSFVLSNNNDDLTLALISPDGQEINSGSTASSGITYEKDTVLGLTFFTIENPTPGKWEVRVNGADTLPNDSTSLSYPMRVQNPLELYLSGFTNEVTQDSILIKARLFDLGDSVILDDIKIEGTVVYSDSLAKALTFKDDGIFPDSLASDGIFTALYSPKATGGHAFIANITGKIDGFEFIRQAILERTFSSANCETKVWYADTDKDGYGDPDSSQEACEQPNGYVTDNTDCNDTNKNIYPGAIELNDGLDNDCDGKIEVDSTFNLIVEISLPEEVTDSDLLLELYNIEGYQLLDSMSINENSYSFDNLNNGEYLIKVTPDPILHPLWVDTYSGNAILRYEATPIKLESDTIYRIDLQKVTSPSSGKSIITGSVSLDSDKNLLEGVIVYLIRQEDGTITAKSISGTNGKIEFNDLEEDFYILKVDYEGKRMSNDNPIVEIDTPNSEVIVSINIKNDEIHTSLESVTGFDDALEQKIDLLPNPIKDQLVVELNAKLGIKRISIYDTLGNLVYKKLIEVSQTRYIVDTKDFTKGLYIVEIYVNGSFIIKKVIK